MASIKETAARLGIISTLVFIGCESSDPKSTHSFDPSKPSPTAGAKAEPLPPYRYPLPTQPALPERTEIPTTQIITKEIERLYNNLPVNQEEVTKIQHIHYEPLSQSFSSQESAHQEAQRRLQETLRYMEHSENPYFKKAASILKPPEKQTAFFYTVDYKLIERLTDANNEEMDIIYGLEEFGQQLTWRLYLNTNYVLFDSNASHLAAKLVGTAARIEDVQQRRKLHQEHSGKTVPPLTTIDETMESEEKEIKREAYFYSQIIEAALYQRALTGLTESPSLEHAMVIYSHAGRNPESNHWLAYMTYGRHEGLPTH